MIKMHDLCRIALCLSHAIVLLGGARPESNMHLAGEK
jgi:hypothetical protein